VAIQSFWLARHHRFKRELAAMPESVDVHLLPTGTAPDIRYNDFTRVAEMIDGAYAASSDYLDGRPAAPAYPAGVVEQNGAGS
jgi:NTE family protein